MPINATLSFVSKLAVSLPIIVGVLCAVVIGVAFVIGFVKGFRKISWGGAFCLLAGGMFVGLNKILDKTPIYTYLDKRFGEQLTDFWSALAVAFVCTLTAMVLYGICTAIFRRKKKARFTAYKGEESTELFGTGGDGLFTPYTEYSALSDSQLFRYTDDYDFKKEKKRARRTSGKPTLLTRCIGGGVCAVNVAMVLFAVLSAGILLLHATEMVCWDIGQVFKVSAVRYVRDFVLAYALDFATLSLIIGFACLGWKFGLVTSLRVLLWTIGVLGTLVLCFGFPFTKFVNRWHFSAELLARCKGVVAIFSTNNSALFGKLIMGGLIFLVGIGVIILVNILLSKLIGLIENFALARSVDRIFAVFAYMVAGILICVTFWAVLYACDYCGFFNVGELFTEKAKLANGIYQGGDRWLKPLFDKVVDRFN